MRGNHSRLKNAALGLGATLIFSGCITDSTTFPITSPSSAATLAKATLASAPAQGPRAVKIIFRQSSPSGSFDPPPAAGTPAAPGSGLQAVRVFNADGSPLASSPTSSTWPKWLNSVEIGISGANNVSATNADCARFAGSTEAATATCHFDANAAGAATPCGASAGLYRVSEYDCVKPTGTSDGNGGPGDGVYIRASFSRDPNYLAAGENIMAVVEYGASALNPAPANPTSCFGGGVLTPEACADMAWKIFIKHTATETVQPFLLLVPPALANVNTATNTGGSGVSTRQFIVPLAGDPNLSVIQISRIHALSPTPTFYTVCSSSGSPTPGPAANSALCVGMVFYSITFYRI